MAEIRWQRNAGRVTGYLRATTGRLTVEDDRLVFRPRAVERALMAREWSMPLANVTGLRVAGARPLRVLAGGLRPRLALDVGDGKSQLFVMQDPQSAADELEALTST